MINSTCPTQNIVGLNPPKSLHVALFTMYMTNQLHAEILRKVQLYNTITCLKTFVGIELITLAF